MDTPKQERHLVVFAQYVIWAMEGRGEMSNQAIYKEVKRICQRYGRVLPPNWKSETRQTLQSHCPGRPQHNKRDDFFVWHGRGYWSCKVASPSIADL
jgi:hypothetical protein